mmetsp:Transcript_40042/g.128452  ORF Transcript_40042/g.128452 Transcript_40042/m.128452 type:complete len:262 (-) Transcript_40042:275-1060(-)
MPRPSWWAPSAICRTCAARCRSYKTRSSSRRPPSGRPAKPAARPVLSCCGSGRTSTARLPGWPLRPQTREAKVLPPTTAQRAASAPRGRGWRHLGKRGGSGSRSCKRSAPGCRGTPESSSGGWRGPRAWPWTGRPRRAPARPTRGGSEASWTTPRRRLRPPPRPAPASSARRGSAARLCGSSSSGSARSCRWLRPRPRGRPGDRTLSSSGCTQSCSSCKVAAAGCPWRAYRGSCSRRLKRCGEEVEEAPARSAGCAKRTRP